MRMRVSHQRECAASSCAARYSAADTRFSGSLNMASLIFVPGNGCVMTAGVNKVRRPLSGSTINRTNTIFSSRFTQGSPYHLTLGP